MSCRGLIVNVNFLIPLQSFFLSLIIIVRNIQVASESQLLSDFKGDTFDLEVPLTFLLQPTGKLGQIQENRCQSSEAGLSRRISLWWIWNVYHTSESLIYRECTSQRRQVWSYSLLSSENIGSIEQSFENHSLWKKSMPLWIVLRTSSRSRACLTSLSAEHIFFFDLRFGMSFSTKLKVESSGLILSRQSGYRLWASCKSSGYPRLSSRKHHVWLSSYASFS